MLVNTFVQPQQEDVRQRADKRIISATNNRAAGADSNLGVKGIAAARETAKQVAAAVMPKVYHRPTPISVRDAKTWWLMAAIATSRVERARWD